MYRIMHSRTRRLCLALALCLLGMVLAARPGWAATATHRLTNLGDRSFTVSWTTAEATDGSVRYGTSPDRLISLAHDDRGQGATATTHHITITGLTPETTYFYEIVSGGTVMNDGGHPFKAATGPELGFALPSIVSGRAYLEDGATPAAGAIAYVHIGSSQELSALADESGTWAVDIGRIRTADLRTRYTPAEDEPVSVRVITREGGRPADPVTTTLPANEVKTLGLGIVPQTSSAGAPVDEAQGAPGSSDPPIGPQPEAASPVNWWLVGGAAASGGVILLVAHHLLKHRYD